MRRVVAAIAALCLPTLARAHQAPTDTVRHTVLISGRPAGAQHSWAASDGAHHYRFEFNDRGRGPALTSRVMPGANAVPLSIGTTGHDYLKNPVSERFTRAARRVSWKNSAEQGSREVGADAFYVSMDGVPEERALLARALLAAPGRRLPLLPDGEAQLTKIGERVVRSKGRSQAVVHYEISGLGLTPEAVWLDRDGQLFAQGSSWFMVIRRGWESAQPALLKAQDASALARGTTMARTLARKPTTPLVFRNGTLFDAETGGTRPRTTVVVTGNRITAVGAEGEVAIPEGAEVIDVTGKAVLPGLWDMHVHISENDGPLHLAAGVTTVRDLANDTDELLARRRRFDEGSLLGPRVVIAGFMDGPGPYAGPTKVLVATEEEARTAVDRYAKLGYVQIKVYSSIERELVPAIVDRAHKRGLRVSGHVPAFMTAEEVVQLGFDELQHANFLFLNFWGDSVKDTRTPLRFTAVAERAATLDLSSARVQDFIRLLKERAVVLDPTVNIFEGMFTARKGSVDPGYAMVADRLPPQVRRGLLTGGLPVPNGMDGRYRDSFAAVLKLVKMMYDAGIPIVAGTDAFAGFALHRELELYEQAGIPAPEVLRIATLGAARVMKMDKELGSIAPGKLADLIVVDGNPVQRVGDIRHVALVVKNGTLYEPASLYRAAGVRPSRQTSP